MSILQLIVAIIVIALAFWANNAYIPAPFRLIVNLILIIVCVFLVLAVTGLLGSVGGKVV